MADPALTELRQTAKTYAPDAYITALLAPPAHQPALLAIAAFLGDVERITTALSEPAVAEIRLQWWRDALTNADTSPVTGHPGADALIAAVQDNRLPFDEFDALLDARALDLYADPLPDEAALHAYLNKTDGAAFRLMARGLGNPFPKQSALIATTTLAYGLTRAITRMPLFLSRGRAPFPELNPNDRHALRAGLAARTAQARQALATSRRHWRNALKADRSACLSLALVEPYLAAANQTGHDPARALTCVEPLSRMWRLWQANALGRF